MPTDMSAYDPFTHRGTCSPFWLLTVEGRTLCVTAASVCQASGLLTPTKKKWRVPRSAAFELGAALVAVVKAQKEENGKEEEGEEHRAVSPLMAAQEKLLKQSAMEHFKDRRFGDAGDLYFELSRRAVINVKRKDRVDVLLLNTRLAYLINVATCRLKQKRNVECVELCTQALDGEEASVRLGNGGMTDGTRAKAL